MAEDPGAGAAAVGRAARQATVVTVVLAGIIAAAIWLLVFDLWLGQVERQYLWENARHEMKLGPAVSLKAMMDDGRSAGARVATLWSALVGGAILLAGRYAYGKGRTAGALWTR